MHTACTQRESLMPMKKRHLPHVPKRALLDRIHPVLLRENRPYKVNYRVENDHYRGSMSVRGIKPWVRLPRARQWHRTLLHSGVCAGLALVHP